MILKLVILQLFLYYFIIQDEKSKLTTEIENSSIEITDISNIIKEEKYNLGEYIITFHNDTLCEKYTCNISPKSKDNIGNIKLPQENLSVSLIIFRQ